MSTYLGHLVYSNIIIIIIIATCLFCIHKFTRPTKDTYIRIFDKEGEEVFSINVKTSVAVTYPSDTLGRTLTFNISNDQLQLPINQTFYLLFDAGRYSYSFMIL